MKTKVSLSYCTDIFSDKPNISETDFISQIREPNANKNGNLLNKILKCKRTHKEKNEYYNMGFVGPHLVRKGIGDFFKISPNSEKMIKYTIKVQRELWNINKEIMTDINKESKKIIG